MNDIKLPADLMNTWNRLIYGRIIKYVSFGRSMAPGHKFYCTIGVPGQNSIDIKRDNLDTVLIEAFKEADLRRIDPSGGKGNNPNRLPKPEVQPAPALTTRSAPAPVAPSFPLPPGL